MMLLRLGRTRSGLEGRVGRRLGGGGLEGERQGGDGLGVRVGGGLTYRLQWMAKSYVHNEITAGMIKVSFSALSLMKTQLDHSSRVGLYSTQWFTKVQDWPRLHTHSHHCRQCTRKSLLRGVPADKAQIIYRHI